MKSVINHVSVVKNILIFAIVTIFVFCGTSCNPKNPPEKSKLSREELSARIHDYAEFLSDNYTRMDRFSYEIENGKIKDMYADLSFFSDGLTRAEIKEGESDTAYVWMTYVIMVGISGATQRAQHHCCVSIDAYGNVSEEMYISCQYREAEGVHSLAAEPQPAPDEKVIRGETGWILLKRHVGIIQAADTAGHTWKLIQ